MSEVIIENAVSPKNLTPPPEVAAEAEPRHSQRRAVFPVSEGDVTFLFPDDMTAEGLEELEMYLYAFL
ncbi:MAG: hypothetical protein AAGC92_08285 [Pseudomonadota bacterium]